MNKVAKVAYEKGIDYIGVSVGALIINKRGEIFLSKRSNHTRNEQGCWEAPGGAVNFGEKRKDAIKIEVKEEFGVNIEIVKSLQTSDEILVKQKQHWVPTTYIAKIKDSKEPRIMELRKCDAIGWFARKLYERDWSFFNEVWRNSYSWL